jgi:hypothetical protein
MLGLRFSAFPGMGTAIVYQRFVDRACFFFLISIATAAYIWSRKLPEISSSDN